MVPVPASLRTSRAFLLRLSSQEPNHDKLDSFCSPTLAEEIPCVHRGHRDPKCQGQPPGSLRLRTLPLLCSMAVLCKSHALCKSQVVAALLSCSCTLKGAVI